MKDFVIRAFDWVPGNCLHSGCTCLGPNNRIPLAAVGAARQSPSPAGSPPGRLPAAPASLGAIPSRPGYLRGTLCWSEAPRRRVGGVLLPSLFIRRSRSFTLRESKHAQRLVHTGAAQRHSLSDSRLYRKTDRRERASSHPEKRPVSQAALLLTGDAISPL